MIVIPRTVKPLALLPDSGPEVKALALESLRSVPAWVLLGEPGAGKTEAFEIEARAVHGVCLTIAEFIYGDIQDEWRNRCLFLDGLDEVRASASDRSILAKVKTKLKALGRPHFRVSCRAADWYGQSDCEDIVGASPDGQLRIYALEPLSEMDIRRILDNKLKGLNVEDFIDQADKHDISALLSNPQTLDLIVKAMGGGRWPNSRGDAYQLACEALVQEESRRHRDRTRFQQTPKEELIDAAGQIFAALLLADKSGVALDPSAKSDRFPAMQDLELRATYSAASLNTALFVPSSSHIERLEPMHRSVAEFLAARWLGKQIDSRNVPLNRVLNLILGFDGKAVAGLRGVYGWLALKSLKARHWLIKNDPLTVMLYGDPRPMELEAKKLLLHEIYRQTQVNPSDLWALGSAENHSTLFDAELRDEYLNALLDPQRDDPTQTYVVFILKVLKPVASQTQLTEVFRDIATDGSRWERIRRDALGAWLESSIAPHEMLTFLDELNEGKISDHDKELAGTLLKKLFLNDLTASQTLRYLHIPKSETLGLHQYFWTYEFPERVPEDELPEVLEYLAQRSDLQSLNCVDFHVSRMVAALLARGIQIYGDQVPDLTLFTWLSIGADKYGERRHEPEFDKIISQWLIDRPARYKALMGICYERNKNAASPIQGLFNDSQILRGTPPPPDIGLWHFQQIDTTQNEILAKEHLAEAIRSLWSGRQALGLTLEAVLKWAGDDPIKTSWLEPHLFCEIPDWRKTQNSSSQQVQREKTEIRKQRSLTLAANVSAIVAGTANPALMGQLANVWLNRYTDTRGDTPLDRFKTYCDNYVEIFEAAKSGIPACIKRKDLPSVQEIINLYLKQQAHWIRAACLLGMQLVWDHNPAQIELMDDSTLEKMICFRLTDGTDTPPEWFLHLVKSKPKLMSKTLIAYASAGFKAQKEHVDGIYPLARDTSYAEVAQLSVPPLLNSFPTRIKAGQLRQLNALLKAAMKYEMPELPALIADKLKLKSLDPNQRVYFLLAGTLHNPSLYEQVLWDFVGGSWRRIQHISDFMGNRFSDLSVDVALSAKMLGKLIEIQTPFAEIDWPFGGGMVSQAMSLGEHITGLISKLTTLGTNESLAEINRLLELPTLEKIRRRLLTSKAECMQKLRENTFTLPTLTDVVRILRNSTPTNVADLQAIVLDRLDQIALDIQTSNGDLFRQFWTESSENRHKPENSCRDALLEMLRKYLEPLGIESQPEADCVNDNRTDIRVSFQNNISFPIEIKGEWHRELWTAIQEQLVSQYTKGPDSERLGIYLVLWIGGTEQGPPRDGGKKPTSSAELESRLQNHLPKDLQKRITVRVLNITRP